MTETNICIKEYDSMNFGDCANRVIFPIANILIQIDKLDTKIVILKVDSEDCTLKETIIENIVSQHIHSALIIHIGEDEEFYKNDFESIYNILEDNPVSIYIGNDIGRQVVYRLKNEV